MVANAPGSGRSDNNSMSELQKRWAKAKLSARSMGGTFNEQDEEDAAAAGAEVGATDGGGGFLIEMPETPNSLHDDDGASSASSSSVSSTGTVIPSPGRALFARPQGCVVPSLGKVIQRNLCFLFFSYKKQKSGRY